MKNKVKSFFENFYNNYIVVVEKYRLRWMASRNLCRDVPKISPDYEKSSKNYWASFGGLFSTNWHNFYFQRNGVSDPRYIPEDFFYSKIEPFFNRLEFAKAYADKNLYVVWFYDVNMPKTVFRNVAGVYYDSECNVVDRGEALCMAASKDKVILKAAIDSGGGKNIEVVNNSEGVDVSNRLNALDQAFSNNYIVQEFLSQHSIMASLNPTSVNTIRMMTLFFEGEVYALSSHVRIGVDGASYDHHGIVCGISDSGILSDVAYKYKVGTVVYEHPQGHRFSGVEIPAFNQVVDLSKKLHRRFAHFKLISWDFAIDSSGEPVLIEFNLRWQGLNHHQLTNGPLFGDLTDKVLSKITDKKREWSK